MDSIKHKPGEVVSRVGSSNGYCVVTDTSAVNGREWMLEPANEVQAIAAKHQNGKTEDFIKELGAAYFEAGCGMPGVATALCQSYMAAGGTNPVSGKMPTDAERVTWAMAAAANTMGNVAALKAGNVAQGIVRVESLGSIDEFLASQSKNLNKKLGAKIGEGRLPYEAGKNGVEMAKKTIKETLENATQISSKIPSASVRGEYDLIHVYSSKTNSTVRLRVLPNGKYDFDTLIPEKSSKF